VYTDKPLAHTPQWEMANSTVSSSNGLGSYLPYSRLPMAFLSFPSHPENCSGAVGSCDEEDMVVGSGGGSAMCNGSCSRSGSRSLCTHGAC
jgi:hypothetical protein